VEVMAQGMMLCSISNHNSNKIMKHVFTFVVGALFGYGFKSDPEATLGLVIIAALAITYGFLVSKNEEYRKNKLPGR